MGKALSDLEQKATSWDLSAQNHLATYSRLVKVSEHRTPDTPKHHCTHEAGIWT